jgi:hypothetical protein
MAVGACLKIDYTGASASCLLQGDSTGKTLTSLVGAAGAEIADLNFGTAGVLDLTAVTVDTLQELAAVISAYSDYAASVSWGDDLPTANILDQEVQAKGAGGYVLFAYAASVLDPYALTTWSRYQEMRGSQLAPNSDQLVVEKLINSTTKQAERIAGRFLKARDYGVGLFRPYDFDGNGRDRLILPYPLNSVTHVYIDSERVFGASTEIAAADYIWKVDEGILIYPRNRFTSDIMNVRLAFNAGMTTVDEDVQDAVIETVAWSLARVRGNSLGMRSIADSGVQSTCEVDIPTHARRIFENLRDQRL